MTTFQRLNDTEIDLGGLHFEVYYIDAGDEYGPVIRVFGEIGGKRTETLRFQAFHKEPHYHLSPQGPQMDMTAEQAKDALGWCLAQVREHLPMWLEKAGHGELAMRVDAAALQQGWTKVRDAALASVPKG